MSKSHTLHLRQFHAYCVGTPKSGTHSIAELFGTHYHSSHQPEHEELINMLLAVWNGLASEKALLNYIREKDKRLQLEFDSSHLNCLLIDFLINEFADAKFILTIRDCYSWLDSLINEQLSRPCTPNWQKFRDIRYKRDKFEFAEEERILDQLGLYTLDGYLTYWIEHNKKILTTVPKEKLLVIKTHEISMNVERIADFVGVSADTLDCIKSHSFKAKEKHHILSKIDSCFLNEKINTHCKTLMVDFFPDFNIN